MNKKRTTKKATKKIPSSEIVKKNCFVIMPFGGLFDIYFETIYKKAIHDVGLICNRADDLSRSSNIVNDIWNYTKNADVILADLTGMNPNVFYELGLGHAITKPAVLITESIDHVPFDLRSLRIIIYDKNYPDWGDMLKINITKALEETLQNPEETIPTTFLETVKLERIEVSEHEKDLLDVKNELKSLKREVRSMANPQKIISGSKFNYATLPDIEYLKIDDDSVVFNPAIRSSFNYSKLPEDYKETLIDFSGSKQKK